MAQSIIEKAKRPSMIDLSQYPQLKLLCWSQPSATHLSEDEAFSAYQHYWRFIEVQSLSESEKALILKLVNTIGHGKFVHIF